jgi:hypothetical protein
MTVIVMEAIEKVSDQLNQRQASVVELADSLVLSS